MSLLKQVSVRLKSVRNIQKITKSMKMVSASKFMKAERELQAARPFGYGPRKFYESSLLTEKEETDPNIIKQKKLAEVTAPTTPVDLEKEKKLKRIYIAMTSDRGLCGGVHSGIVRRIKHMFKIRAATIENHKIVCIGDKSRVVLRNSNPKNILVSATEIGRLAPVFADASMLAAGITEAGFGYDIGEIYYNKYHSPAKYELSVIPVFTQASIENAPNITAFDELDSSTLQSYAEWTLAALLFFAMKESASSEQSSRMAAMTNATKNAEEMLGKLTVLFNRTRQSVITRELIEIISGAAALN